MPRPITLVQPHVSVSEFIPRATVSGSFTDFQCHGRAAVLVDFDLGVLSADLEKIFMDENFERGLEGWILVDGHVESGFRGGVLQVLSRDIDGELSWLLRCWRASPCIERDLEIFVVVHDGIGTRGI